MPQFYRTDASFTDEAFEVVTTRLDVDAAALRAAVALLSDTERQRARRFAFDRERRRFTVARARLRQLLAARLGVRPESVELNYGTHGKPVLAGRHANTELHFNLSHSEDVAVYALAHGRDIGIDVEAVRVLRDADEIAARFFSHCENQAYLALEMHDRPQGFFNCWTRKEAFVKALGDGLSHPLDRFDVSLAPGEPARILSVDGIAADDNAWTVHSFVPWPGFIAAVVLRKIDDNSATRETPNAIFLPSQFAPHTSGFDQTSRLPISCNP